jgi:hypothetical protein
MVSIATLRRVGLIGFYGLARAGVPARGIYARHVENARRAGLRNYLRLANFVHRNTDGPDNPYTKVYSVAEVRRDFSSFEVTRVHKEFMHAPPLPVHELGLARLAGWHLWAHLRPRPSPATGSVGHS